MGEATTLERAMCVFEQNTGVPLRRHLSYSRDQGAFYGGMSDSVLIFRSILTIVNYDYVMDFVFHQVGSAQVSNGLNITSCLHEPFRPCSVCAQCTMHSNMRRAGSSTEHVSRRSTNGPEEPLTKTIFLSLGSARLYHILP